MSAVPDRVVHFTPVTGFAAVGELVGIIQRLSVAQSLDEIKSIVRSAARRLTNAEGSTFVLREGSYCHYSDDDTISPLLKGRRLPLDVCVSGYAMQHRENVLISDIDTDPRVPQDAYRHTFVKSMCIVPIGSHDPIGAIGSYWGRPQEVQPIAVMLLQALADSTAAALEHVRLVSELEEARTETLLRLARAAEYRDDDTFRHTERVARTSAAIAERLGMPQDVVTTLRQAAPLHDIGKIALNDSLLLKPAALTADERLHMQAHVFAGAAILEGSRSGVLRMAREIVLTHHEWWNGTGYPNHLRGEDIPLSGRIVALADVFDALTHTRPYKPAWPVNAVLAKIEELRGVHFDPRVVDAFRRLDSAAFIDIGRVAKRPFNA